jgi:hypothetical protein
MEKASAKIAQRPSTALTFVANPVCYVVIAGLKSGDVC